MSQNFSSNRNIILFLSVSTILIILIYLSPKNINDSPVKIRLGITHKPGFDYLFIAKKNGFFKQADLDIELVELSSLAEVRRAFERGKIDAMTATLVEVLEAYKYSNHIGQAILITGYSNGVDEILVLGNINDLKDLRGKKIGVEAGTVSTYIASLALNMNNIARSEVIFIPMEFHKLPNALKTGKVDAITSYPPKSFSVKKQLEVNVIFDSSKLPHYLLEIVAVNKNVLIKHPDLQGRFRKAWDLTMDYVNSNPDDAYITITDHYNLSAEEYKKSMDDAHILSANEQDKYFNEDKILKESLNKIGEVVFNNSNQQGTNYSQFIFQSESK